MLSADDVRDRFKEYAVEHYSYDNMTAMVSGRLQLASVLVPISLHQGEPYVLLTRRSDKMRTHPGQVAFPGGKQDDTDLDAVHTCLREAEEEVGLQPSSVEIIGRMPPRVTRHGVFLNAMVGLVPHSFKETLSDEVASTFRLPLRRFLSADRHTGTSWTGMNTTVLIHNFEDTIDGQTYLTWGLTANMCIEVAVAVLKALPEYQYSFDGPMTIERPFHMQEIYLEKLLGKFSKL